jgi:hypothetical protein
MNFSCLYSQLRTNYIPTEEEVLHIKTSKLEAVERELERIEALFIDLSIQRKNLRAEIDRYRTLISPARRLLLDILQEIFIYTAHNALMDPVSEGEF